MTSRIRGTVILVFCRRAFIGIVACYIGACLGAGGTNSARPIFYGAAATWCAALLGMQCYCKRCFLTQAPDKWARGGRTAEIVAFNLALTVVLAEAALNGLASCSGTSLLVSDALDAYRLTPGQDYGAGLRGNYLGYPGDDFRIDRRSGICRIAALGDSFAVGPAVPFAKNYLTLLEKQLPDIEVYNFGVSGTGPREYLAILRTDVPVFQPDWVLVNVFVGNDITESMATPRRLDPRQHALYLLLTRGSRLLQEHWRAASRETGPMNDRCSAGALSPQSFAALEGRRLAVCRRAPPAELEKKWQRALSYLGTIIGECRRRSLRVGFILIPDEFQVNPAVFHEALESSGLGADALDLELPQRRLQRFLAEHGVPCLDLQPAFRTESDTYALRDSHWNVHGNHLAAQCIAAWLIDVLGPGSRAAP